MKRFTLLTVFTFLLLSLQSCDAIAGIFEAGFNVGIFVAIAAVVLIIFLIVKMFSGKK